MLEDFTNIYGILSPTRQSHNYYFVVARDTRKDILVFPHNLSAVFEILDSRKLKHIVHSISGCSVSVVRILILNNVKSTRLLIIIVTQ